MSWLRSTEVQLDGASVFAIQGFDPTEVIYAKGLVKFPLPLLGISDQDMIIKKATD